LLDSLLQEMGLIEDELDSVKKCCEIQVPGTKVVTAVPALLRVEVEKTPFKKIIVCLMFSEEYPTSPILIELKSKTLSSRLLDGLTQVTEKEIKKTQLGKPQGLFVIQFISKFIEDNPLCCCSQEISKVKSLLGPKDSLKLSQKSSTVTIKITKENYYLIFRCIVPQDYPSVRVDIEEVDCNFPRVFRVWFIENSRELARRCVEAPLKPKPNAPKFEPRPSLDPAVQFLIASVQRYPVELCQICSQKLFPDDPSLAIQSEKTAFQVERVYCGHAYHHDCLIMYMRSPPFTGGKDCPECGNRIYHEKWKVTPELAEARWASEQAKARELGDVVEFVNDTCS